MARLDHLQSQPTYRRPFTDISMPGTLNGFDLAQWVRSSLASQRLRLTQENLIQEENTDQILSDLAEHATNPTAAI